MYTNYTIPIQDFMPMINFRFLLEDSRQQFN